MEQRFIWLAPEILPFYREYYPFSDSNHRCDFAWPDQGLIVEIDGGQYAPQGGSHTSKSDYQKINKLIEYGWRILRYNTAMLGDVSQVITPTMADDTLWIVQQIGRVLQYPPQPNLVLPPKGVKPSTRRVSQP